MKQCQPLPVHTETDVTTLRWTLSAEKMLNCDVWMFLYVCTWCTADSARSRDQLPPTSCHLTQVLCRIIKRTNQTEHHHLRLLLSDGTTNLQPSCSWMISVASVKDLNYCVTDWKRLTDNHWSDLFPHQSGHLQGTLYSSEAVGGRRHRSGKWVTNTSDWPSCCSDDVSVKQVTERICCCRRGDRLLWSLCICSSSAAWTAFRDSHDNNQISLWLVCLISTSVLSDPVTRLHANQQTSITRTNRRKEGKKFM